MRMLKITPEQADAAYTILCQEAGEHDDARGDKRHSFVHHVSTASTHPADEYRFQGALGFGGKFRNNGNKPHPYVDCYRENGTPERRAMIERTNAALAALFSTDA